MAHHEVLIEAGDHLILFLSEKKMVSKNERLLQVSGFLLSGQNHDATFLIGIS